MRSLVVDEWIVSVKAVVVISEVERKFKVIIGQVIN